MKDVILYLIGIFLVIILFIGFIAILAVSAYWLDVVECNQKFSEFERKQNGFYARCMIKVDGKWIPSDRYREIEE